MSPEQVVRRIAEVAEGVATQSGEPGMEIAGMIVSMLATRPELTDAFMAEGAELLIDGRLDWRKDMSLSYRDSDGVKRTATELRKTRGFSQ